MHQGPGVAQAIAHPLFFFGGMDQILRNFWIFEEKD
jgi:hypothetical protein